MLISIVIQGAEQTQLGFDAFLIGAAQHGPAGAYQLIRVIECTLS